MRKMDSKNFDLNLLIALDVILEELHISRSAKRLNISQSATSRALAKLRDMFDDPLIVRVSKGYQRTPRGESLVKSVKSILSEVESTFETQEFEPAEFKGELTICTLDYGEAVLLPAIMEKVSQEAPGATIKIIHRKIYSISEVLDGNADILLGTIPDNPPKHCNAQFLYSDRFVCVVSKDHPLARKTITLEDYVSYPHSIIHTGESPGTSIDVALAKIGKSRHIMKSSPHFAASVFSIVNTNMIQTIPLRLAGKLLLYSDLVVKELPFETGAVEIGQMWHRRNSENLAHRWFRQLIKSVAS